MKKYLLNTFLAAAVAAAMLAMVIARAICPILVLPGFDVPNLVLISLVALLMDHYLVKDAVRCYICIPVFAFLTFALLPFAARLMTYECGIRFLTDHLNGDTYFRIHREGHNLDRARTQFKLVADMEAKDAEMRHVVAELWAWGQ